MPTVADHIARIDQVAELYEASSGDDPNEVMTDLLSDMLLWCMANDVDFQKVLRLGRMNARAEWNEAAQWAGGAR